MLEEAKTLVKFTKGTRDDCHECDEQGLSFVACVGNQLDNAFGKQVTEDAIARGFQEVVLLLKREQQPYRFNLATLLAFAKVGAEQYLIANQGGGQSLHSAVKEEGHHRQESTFD